MQTHWAATPTAVHADNSSGSHPHSCVCRQTRQAATPHSCACRQVIRQPPPQLCMQTNSAGSHPHSCVCRQLIRQPPPQLCMQTNSAGSHPHSCVCKQTHQAATPHSCVCRQTHQAASPHSWVCRQLIRQPPPQLVCLQTNYKKKRWLKCCSVLYIYVRLWSKYTCKIHTEISRTIWICAELNKQKDSCVALDPTNVT